jgi:hypothetical protein
LAQAEAAAKNPVKSEPSGIKPFQIIYRLKATV